MYKNKKILALVPARSNSKRLPRKNIRSFAGKPLIAWTIEYAKHSKYVDRIIVSTDDREIIRISEQYGAEVPFLRPHELATDEAKTIDVILHAINWFNNENLFYDLVMLLQPTSPLRVAEDIDKAIELLFLKDAKAIVSVSKTECHPSWINTLPEDGCMKNFFKREFDNKASYGSINFYTLNGAIYLSYSDYIIKQKSFFGNRTFAYIMPRERSIDIDDEIDFRFAEFSMMNNLKFRKRRLVGDLK